ncbi:MFS general substrate transporter [Viridothelium virens]|uniref:MFS general substrate transporter n=1 Tax=Viridothelium virens TaxID=1048519 RepID=A0A6A6H626_VIRVR|nr:MFS general substrate transporter [Viridothelium virens]
MSSSQDPPGAEEVATPGYLSPVKTNGKVPDEDVRSENSESSNETQAGVKRIEAISSTWTTASLTFAYLGLYLMAFTTSLEQQTTTNLTVYATSAFSEHSLVATVAVVQSVIQAVIKPVMAKIADVFGRYEAFSISVFVYVIGYIQQAASNNVKTFAAAQIFYSAGWTGLQILQQIFIADTSDLLNRALFATIPDIPFLATVWAGPPIAESLIKHASWRWGYGIWAIVLPVAFLPLALTLFLNQRKAAKLYPLPKRVLTRQSAFASLKNLWFDLDFFGVVLLSAAICLILLPLTLASLAKGGWKNASMIAMIVIGGIFLVCFPFWERSKRLAPHALFPPDVFRNRTVLAGYSIAFFYFMAFYLSVYPYFYSYLLIVQNQSITAAGHITQTFTFTSTVTSIIVSILIKYTRHYKYFITLGSAIYLMGIGLMIRYRTQGVSTGVLVGCQIAVGIGGGMLNVPAQLGVQASVSHQRVAAATAVFLTILEIGGAVGTAISGAIWTANVPKKLAAYLPDETKGQAAAIFGSVEVASGMYPVGSPTRAAIDRAYQETMTTILIVAVCVCAPLIPLSLVMKDYKLDELDQRVKGKVIGGTRNTSGLDQEGSSPDGEVQPPSKKRFLDRILGHRRQNAADP